jgi:hypothetical protein
MNYFLRAQEIKEIKKSNDQIQDLFGGPVVLYFEQTEDFYITKKTKVFITFEKISCSGEVSTEKKRISKEDKFWIYFYKEDINEMMVLYAIAKKRKLMFDLE